MTNSKISSVLTPTNGGDLSPVNVGIKTMLRNHANAVVVVNTPFRFEDQAARSIMLNADADSLHNTLTKLYEPANMDYSYAVNNIIHATNYGAGGDICSLTPNASVINTRPIRDSQTVQIIINQIPLSPNASYRSMVIINGICEDEAVSITGTINWKVPVDITRVTKYLITYQQDANGNMIQVANATDDLNLTNIAKLQYVTCNNSQFSGIFMNRLGDIVDNASAYGGIAKQYEGGDYIVDSIPGLCSSNGSSEISSASCDSCENIVKSILRAAKRMRMNAIHPTLGYQAECSASAFMSDIKSAEMIRSSDETLKLVDRIKGGVELQTILNALNTTNTEVIYRNVAPAINSAADISLTAGSGSQAVAGATINNSILPIMKRYGVVRVAFTYDTTIPNGSDSGYNTDLFGVYTLLGLSTLMGNSTDSQLKTTWNFLSEDLRGVFNGIKYNYGGREFAVRISADAFGTTAINLRFYDDPNDYGDMIFHNELGGLCTSQVCNNSIAYTNAMAMNVLSNVIVNTATTA